MSSLRFTIVTKYVIRIPLPAPPFLPPLFPFLKKHQCIDFSNVFGTVDNPETLNNIEAKHPRPGWSADMDVAKDLFLAANRPVERLAAAMVLEKTIAGNGDHGSADKAEFTKFSTTSKDDTIEEINKMIRDGPDAAFHKVKLERVAREV